MNINNLFRTEEGPLPASGKFRLMGFANTSELGSIKPTYDGTKPIWAAIPFYLEGIVSTGGVPITRVVTRMVASRGEVSFETSVVVPYSAQEWWLERRIASQDCNKTIETSREMQKLGNVMVRLQAGTIRGALATRRDIINKALLQRYNLVHVTLDL